jgi:hypothetical protein
MITNEAATVGVLSDSAVEEIEKLVGYKIAYIVAFNAENAVPLRPASVTPHDINPTRLDPIKTTEIYSINSAAYGSFEGSCCVYWISGGRRYCFPVSC